MFGALWTPLGDRFADKWAPLLLSPALAFWCGGVLAWARSHGGWHALDQRFHELFGTPTAAGQVALLGVALLIVAASARLLDGLTMPVLRLLEGYWPRWAAPVRTGRIRLRGRRIDADARRWRELSLREDRDAAEDLEYATLDARRALVPTAPADRMPTRLGDLLRAAEARPGQRYGLETVTCWPRLWLLLPEQARADIGAARGKVDAAVGLWLAGAAFAVWTVFTWWALAVAVIVAAVAYRALLAAASTYAQLLQSCFDLHRRSLYEALDVPWDTRTEPLDGQRITEHLSRGTALAGGR